MERAVILLLLALAINPSAADSDNYRTVKSARQFIIGPVGWHGIVSDEEKAFNALCKAPDAADQFRRILREGTIAGKMYALLGLRQVSAPDYKQQASRFRNSTATVETVSGCAVEQDRVSTVVVEWIDKMPLK